jgi:energy-coupling factor transport system permease protein
MNNITIGQYIPGDSWLHRLDPRIKMFALVVLLVGTFIIPISTTWGPVASMGAIFIGMLILTASAGIPIKKMVNGLKPIVFLLTFTFFIQLFFITEGKLLVSFDFNLSLTSIAAMILVIIFYNWSKKYVKFRILYFLLTVVALFAVQYFIPFFGPNYAYTLDVFDEGLMRAGFIFIRITNVIIMTSLLTFTTMTTDLNYAIESLLKPLKWIKVPVDVIAMMLSLTLRYIPTLLAETEKIMKAQASRGVDFKESKFKDKVVQIISLLIPVFVISFKRAEDLGNAMEVRGYVIGAKRTKIDQYHIGFSDIMALITVLLFLAAIITVRIYG